MVKNPAQADIAEGPISPEVRHYCLACSYTLSGDPRHSDGHATAAVKQPCLSSEKMTGILDTQAAMPLGGL